MFDNAAPFPSEPINNFPKPTGLVVDPGHITLDRGAEVCMGNSLPDRAQDVPGSLSAVLGGRIVILCAELAVSVAICYWL